LEGGQSISRSFGAQRQKLLTKGKVFEKEILARTESTNNPTQKMSEVDGHGQNLIGSGQTRIVSKSFIPRWHGVLAKDNPISIQKFPRPCFPVAKGRSTLVTLTFRDSVAHWGRRAYSAVVQAVILWFPLLILAGSIEFRSDRNPTLSASVTKRMIWAEDEDFTGWRCCQCRWTVIAPRLDTTVAVLAFNRIAQEGFEKHRCVPTSEKPKARAQSAST